MSNPKNRKQLIALSVAVFAQFPTQTSLFATADGNFFIQEDRAKLHANQSNPKMKIFEIDVEEAREIDPDLKVANSKVSTSKSSKDSSDELVPKSKVLQGNSKDAVTAVKTETSLEVLQELKADEKATKNRSTVLKAIKKRVTELNAPPAQDPPAQDPPAETK